MLYHTQNMYYTKHTDVHEYLCVLFCIVCFCIHEHLCVVYSLFLYSVFLYSMMNETHTERENEINTAVHQNERSNMYVCMYTYIHTYFSSFGETHNPKP